MFMLYCTLPYNTECSKLDHPVGGLVVMEGTQTDDIAMYTCYDGLYVYGAVTRVCMNNSQWSGQQPDCLRKHTHTCIHQLLLLRVQIGLAVFNNIFIGLLAGIETSFSVNTIISLFIIVAIAIAVTIVVIVGRWRKRKLKKSKKITQNIYDVQTLEMSLSVLPEDQKTLTHNPGNTSQDIFLDGTNATLDDSEEMAQLSTSPTAQESVMLCEMNADGPANQL